jgi:death-on-curing protein
MSDPLFLTVSHVKRLHRMALELHGGQDGIRDPGALESAVQQPQNVFGYARGDLFEIAAAYAFHVAEAQSFIDGNKRAGMASALVFLKLNGVVVPAAHSALHEAMIRVSARTFSRSELAELLRGLAPTNGRTS